ncbi:hypothetical protein ACFX11_020545 [Malus domestica]
MLGFSKWNELATKACYQLVVNSIGTWNKFATEDDVLQCMMSEQIGDDIGWAKPWGRERRWMRHCIHGFGGPSAATARLDEPQSLRRIVSTRDAKFK